MATYKITPRYTYVTVEADTPEDALLACSREWEKLGSPLTGEDCVPHEIKAN